ncbi:LOW QUALITY PROTEIN: armadillo repeat-containing protein 3-like [Erethizon dorsatum]
MVNYFLLYKEVEPPPKDVFEPLTMESKEAATVVLMLSSPEEEVLAKACEAIYKFALKGEENKATLLELEAVEPLTKLLTHEDKIMRRNATMIFGILTSNAENRKLFHKQEVEKCLVTLLGSESDRTKIADSQAIVAMCENTSSRDFFNTQGIAQLVHLLKSDNEEVREAAGLALAILTFCSPVNAKKNVFAALASRNRVFTLPPGGGSGGGGARGDEGLLCSLIDPGAKLLPLKELCLQEPGDQRAVLLIDNKSIDVSLPREDKSSDISYGNVSSSSSLRANKEKPNTGFGFPTELKLESTSGRNTVLSKSATKEKGSREGRGEKEEKVKEEEEVLAIPKLPGEGSPDEEWCPPPDPDFCTYVNEVTKSILPMTNMKERIEVPAKCVAEKMGGKILKDKIPDFSWELHISELKFQLKSNVIPIRYIKKGIFYHRALLFKPLADRIGIGCSVVRGKYGRAWNEVKVVDLSRKGVTGGLPVPDHYTIGLMFHPGGLMKLGGRGQSEEWKVLHRHLTATMEDRGLEAAFSLLSTRETESTRSKALLSMAVPPGHLLVELIMAPVDSGARKKKLHGICGRPASPRHHPLTNLCGFLPSLHLAISQKPSLQVAQDAPQFVAGLSSAAGSSWDIGRALGDAFTPT